MECLEGLMRVQRDMGGDYYLYVPKDVAVALDVSRKWSRDKFRSNWLTAKVESDLEGIDETLGLTLSNDSSVGFHSEQMTFSRGEDLDYPQDINLRVFPAKFWKLVKGEIPYIMDRYDGENKVWIHLED